MALQMAIPYGKKLSENEINALIDHLFACQVADTAPDGKKVFKVFNMNEIATLFK